MSDPIYFADRIFQVNADNFTDLSLKLFRYQAVKNAVYRKYLQNLRIDPGAVTKIEDIPFLPISFFKTQKILTPPEARPVTFFESSGTTGQQRSRHYVADLHLYQKVSQTMFELTYGKLSDFHIFALLPSYLERKHASLVAMADFFIRQSHSEYSGFYLKNYQELIQNIRQAKDTRRTLLMGVSFALLDLAEQYQPDLQGVTVMETGGMKGRRKEMTREELHTILSEKLNVKNIHSEYGMTELLSQAYARHNGTFKTPPWMKILIRDINDPFYINSSLRAGGINVIDLANIYSCAFIETQDLGRTNITEETFEVLGRFDNSDIRGCNLMIQ